jgi:hypothetical protein
VPEKGDGGKKVMAIRAKRKAKPKSKPYPQRGKPHGKKGKPKAGK